MSNIILPSGGDAGYQIQRSLRLRSSATAYLSKTFGTASLGATFSFWVKRGALPSASAMTLFGYSNGSNESFSIDFSSDKLDFFSYSVGYIARRLTTQVFRDSSAWYHIVCVVDSANATALDRLRVYVNGSRVTTFDATVNQAINQNLNLTQGTWAWGIGREGGAANQYFDGYLAEFNFIDGQALTPSSFGQIDPVTGVWAAKKYAGTYGTNGFYLPFTDNSAATAAAIGKDFSGNGNNWTPNNISVTAGVTYDSMLDVPLGAGGAERGNYATLNPLSNRSNAVVLDGNLNSSSGTNLVYKSPASTIPVANSGKWYAEVTCVSSAGSNYEFVGIADVDEVFSTTFFGGTTKGIGYSNNSSKWINSVNTAYGATWTTGDIIGIAVDMDALTLTFYKNNVSQGVISSAMASANNYVIGFSRYGSAGSMAINFGQRPFSYTPPTGFKALHTGNLPDPVIKLPASYMDAKTWTSVAAAQTISGLQFQPDLLWLKSRSFAEGNTLIDSIRGSSKYVTSSSTAAEATSAAFVSSINADGWSMGASQFSAGAIVTWAWKANGAAVSNTAGSITSQVSAGVSQGFSVVTYTGTGANATVGHGLGVAPKMVIVKRRDAAPYSWIVWQTALAGTEYLILESTNAKAALAAVWNSTIPSSTVFSLGSNTTPNSSGGAYVAYCFSEVAGYSKFGSYTGNGSADGPFVFCGFRPRFVMIKNSSAVSYWYTFDSARNTYNLTNLGLQPNLSNAESSSATACVDLLSNGFKSRGAASDINSSGATFIYACFAENPFKYSLAR